MLRVIAAVLVVGVLFLINAYLYRENQRTPKPEGCKDISEVCGSCKVADCAIKKKVVKDA